MKSGLLWYYKGDVLENVELAIGRYREKFGATPNMVFMYEGDGTETVLAAAREKFPNVQFGTKKTIMPKHLFVGVREETAPTNQ